MPNHMLFLESAKEAARIGADVLRKYWGKITQIEEKSHAGDLVTQADRDSEKAIIHFLNTQFPHHQILAEESGLQNGEKNEYFWVIDPLDGTTNYAHQFPMVSVSIALLYHQQPIVGVVYNPFHEELFSAAKGYGSRLNDKKIMVSSIEALNKSLLVTGFAYDRSETTDTNYGEFAHLTHLTQGVRRMGSAALDLAYVACGRLDGYWERGLKEWDMAAGVLLVQEAGGKVTAYDESAFDLSSGRVLATNGRIHSVLSKALLSVKQ